MERRSSIALKRKSFDAVDSTLATYSAISSAIEESFKAASSAILEKDELINDYKEKLPDVHEIAKRSSRLVHYLDNSDDSLHSNYTSYVKKLAQEEKQWKSLVAELGEQISNIETTYPNIESLPTPGPENTSKKNLAILKKKLCIDKLRLQLDADDNSLMECLVPSIERVKELISKNKKCLSNKAKLLNSTYIIDTKIVLSRIF
ncbi:hypothetical protein HELRODRAFT_163399 [Helobdella robusta]|uniref:Uncharacterized protein n=1 Tax=Helobdella robusta TaxID=6412 RepID=T1EU03_HELRO|nr:hypothetical protein HELRODRAFT_163399 [Helobdella robusta]ESN96348.1 hypothetical protein HELRODRAFT_163399 [Helobdella robusta]